MGELLEFLDKYNVKYKVENGKVRSGYINLSYKGITELPKDFGKLVCDWLYLNHNHISELPKSIGDIHCKRINLHENPIPKNKIKYLERIENLELVWTDYSDDLSCVKQLCRVNTRQDKIKSLLD
jgi:Leucine-rich repeat (LRR) protein